MARVRSSPTPAEGTSSDAPALPAPRAKAAAGASKRRPKPTAAPGPNPKRNTGRQVALLAGIAACGWTAVALGSYHAADPSLSVAGGAAVENLTGPAGAVVADALYQSVGWSAWGIVPVGAWLAMRLAGRSAGGLLGLFLGGVGLVLTAAGLQLCVGALPDRPFPPGGVTGILVADALVTHVGKVGAGLAVATGLLTVATVLFGINWQPLAARAVDRVQAGAPVAARGIGAVGAGAVKAGLRIGGAGVDALRTRLAGAEEEADAGEDEEEVEDEAVPELPSRAVAPQLPERASTSRASVSEVPKSLPEAPAQLPSVWSARAAPRLPVIAPDADRDTPTKVAGRTLVEVEWEPTSAHARAAEPARRDATTPPRPTPAPKTATPPRAPTPPPREATVPPIVHRPEPSLSAVVAGEEPPRRLDVPPPTARLTDPGVAAERAPVAPVAERPSLARPAAPPVAPPRAPAPVVADPDDLDAPAAREADPPSTDALVPLPEEAPPAPAPKPRAKSRGAFEVVPGNLQSGGRTDDGKAIRKTSSPFELPPLSLLDDHPAIVATTDEAALTDMARRLTQTLREFDVEGRVSAIRPGPVITMFEYEPAPGVKLSKIEGLADNLKMALKAISVRIVAPIPGRGCVGIEIPNERRQTVWGRDVFASNEFREGGRTLPMILGKDTEGRPFVTDLAKMPHLLICGTTGSGKSVGVNGMLCSMLFTRTPDELRMILIDPKMLEFGLYEDIPHLLHPVVTEPKQASAVLKWACTEMDERYRIMARWQTRHIDSYNQKVERELEDWTPEKARHYAPKDWPEGDLLPMPRRFPYIVIVIDELADLMMVASSDVEMSIARIAQKARAAGIHLIIATQTPRRDVITGVIKANMPSSLAYRVRNGLDSRVILDQNGAEQLLGNGDLLFLKPGTSDLVRIHGPFLTENEVHRVADFLRAQGQPEYDARIGATAAEDMDEVEEEEDDKWEEAIELAMEKGKISTSMIQRHLGIGYNRAANLVEMMEKRGIVGPADGVKPREVLVAR